jgi:multidrug efflux system membrane fusion protein
MYKKRLYQFLLLTGIFIFPACGDKGDRPAGSIEPTMVRVCQVEVSDITFPIHCVGKLSARSEIKLSFKTGGIVSAIYTEEGQTVTEGTKMAQLNLSEIQATANQANLALEKAKRDLERIGNLYRDSVSTREQYENAQTAYNLAANQERIARFNLQYSTITAPSSGQVLKRIAEEDEMIAAGYPVFLFAASKNDWVLKVNLTDKEIVQVNLLDSALISFDAYPGIRFRAWVSEVGNFSDPYTGTYEVELTLQNPAERLVSGFIGRADIIPSKKYRFLTIPVNALLEANEMNGFVYVLENEKAVRKRIEIAGIREEKILVRQGLDSGALVVTEGAAFIGPDSDIRIKQTP